MAVENITEEKVEDAAPNTDFLILGSKSHKKKREVKRVLPDWLAHPQVISADLSSGPTVDEVDSILNPKLIDTLKANGVDKLFPVQASMLTWLTKCEKDRRLGWWPRDTCVSAPTGSGKTLAYVLPIVQQLESRLVPKIRCLIVVPVQELALQVHKVVVTYTAHTNLKAGLITGASSFEQEQSNIIRKNLSDEYTSAVDILVATPGRLIDHILKTPGFSLDALRYLVIDEADRATEWLQYIPEPHSRAPIVTLENLYSSAPPAQKLLFSATLSQDPQKLNQLRLFQPVLYTSVIVSGKDTDVNLDEEVVDFVGRYTSPEELKERAIECSPEFKPLALYKLLVRKNVPKTLVFTNSGESAHRLSLLLQMLLSENNSTVGELSARIVARQREDILNKFASCKVNVLVCSDALARGIDVPEVQLVVSYDLPKHIKGYIHRAGRTGRAGKSGTAVSILTHNQVGTFKQMLSSVRKKVPKIKEAELTELADTLNYEDHLTRLRNLLEEERTVALNRAKATKRKYRQRSTENDKDNK